MIAINVRLELDEEDRRAIASHLAGNPVRRLATRAEVRTLVEQRIRALCTYETPAPAYPAPPRGRSMFREMEPGRVRDEATARQLLTMATFEPASYVPVGMVGQDVIVELRDGTSVVRQRINPQGGASTCRTDSYAVIGRAG